MKFKDGKILFDTCELSRELGLQQNTIHVHAKNGKYIGVKIDNRLHFDIDQFESIDRSKIITKIIQNISKNI